MDREKLQEKLTKQLEETQKFFNLYAQSQGACAMLQALIEELDKEEDKDGNG